MEGRWTSSLCAGLVLVCCAAMVQCDTQCVARFGTCKYTSSGCSGGSFTRGLCNGPVDRQCCVPDYTSADSPCRSRGGTCQRTTTSCGGGYQSGLCGGPADRKCCMRTPTGTTGGGGQAQSCSGVTMVSRAAWGARAPKSTTYMATPVSRVFIHHTAGAACSTSAACIQQAKIAQNLHMDTNRWSDIGYNFLVGGDGKVYEGRGWNREGAHTVGFNDKAIAISFMGNFMSQSPTTAAINAAKNLIACGVSSGKITTTYKLYGHRQADSTSCPGDTLYALIQSWPRYTSGRAV